MSKDMLGPIPRALVQVGTEYHGVILNVIQRLADEEDAPLWYSRFAKALREKLPKEKKQYHFLKPMVPVALDVFNPQNLKSRKDIWLSAEFVEQVLSVAEPFQPTNDLTPPSGFDIIKPANDTEVRSEFPKNHVYGASEFCYVAGKMTQAQPNDTSGTLLSNGYANIFYVIGKGGEVFAVGVSWYGGPRQWDFRCARLGGSGWDPGPRAFSRN
ncbi:MAG: hypothetical protein Q7S34_03945 [bacterium]|nr:hypothetical protein [bacterium]